MKRPRIRRKSDKVVPVAAIRKLSDFFHDVVASNYDSEEFDGIFRALKKVDAWLTETSATRP